MEYSHLSDLQRAEFKILKVFDAICKKYNIKYYMADGTLIGALRHKGFIPWDDDIDIAITRPEYERFREIADKELPSNMFLSTFDTPGHIWLVHRIINKNIRIYLNNATKEKDAGAWLDFEILDGVPKPGLKRIMWSFLYLLARMLYQFSNFSTTVDINRKNRSWYEYLAIRIAKMVHIETLLSSVKMGHFFEWVCTRFNYDKCEYCAMLGNTYQQKSIIPKVRGIIPRAWIGEGVEYQFEDMSILGFQESDKYLRRFYDDYMTPPPVDERVSKHNVKIIEIEPAE